MECQCNGSSVSRWISGDFPQFPDGDDSCLFSLCSDSHIILTHSAETFIQLTTYNLQLRDNIHYSAIGQLKVSSESVKWAQICFKCSNQSKSEALLFKNLLF